MSFPKVAVICGLMAALIGGCGIAAKPQAGTHNLLNQPGFHGVFDDPRGVRSQCLSEHKISYEEFFTKQSIDGTPQHLPAIKIDQGGAVIVFYPDAGTAEGQQIMGQGVGAELIGSALLYPNNTTGGELTNVENCTAVGIG